MKRFFRDLKKYAYFCGYAAKTDLKAEVANSYLNWIWWILEPICSMLVYYFVFSKIVSNTRDFFAIFIFSSILMWGIFNKTISYSVKLVRMNREIVKKVYVPKFILLLSNMALNVVKLLISMIVLIAMMIYYQVPLTINMLYVFPIYLVMLLFTFGCGMILLHFGVFIDDLSHAITILLNMLLYLSGVFYDIEIAIGGKLGEWLLKLNPMAFFISSMRGAMLYGESPDLFGLFVWLLISLVLVILGVHTIYKYENSYVKVV